MTSDQQHFEDVLEGISRGSTADIKVLLASCAQAKLPGAGSQHAGPPQIIWGLVDEEVRNQSLQYLQDDVRAEFLEAMTPLSSWQSR